MGSRPLFHVKQLLKIKDDRHDVAQAAEGIY